MTSISIIIPALNEQEHINEVIDTAVRIGSSFEKYEVICVDDHSVDNTLWFMDLKAKDNPNIQIIHHIKNMGIGGCFKDAICSATCDYCVILAGDGEEDEGAMKKLCSHVGEAEVILAYPDNPRIRSWNRRVLSDAFVVGLNLTCGLNLKYYTGTNIFKTNQIRDLEIPSDFTYMPSLVIQSVKKNKCSYIEVPTKKKKGGKTNMFNISNVVKCAISTTKLILSAYF